MAGTDLQFWMEDEWVRCDCCGSRVAGRGYAVRRKIWRPALRICCWDCFEFHDRRRLEETIFTRQEIEFMTGQGLPVTLRRVA